MADNNESAGRKKSKKKHKKSTKSSAEDQESGAFGSADTNASQTEKSSAPEDSPVAPKKSKSGPEKMAPKAKSSNAQWSHDQGEMLLKSIKRYTTKLSGRQQYSQRVDWSKVDKVDNFTQFEMQEHYKVLTKKVRKTRSAQEVVDDAMVLHKQEKHLPSKNKKMSKQPPSAFSLFCKAKRASLVEKHPELTFGGIHKKLCERWKELSDDKRGKYVSKAEKAKEEFYEELRKFRDQQISQLKKPMSAYDLWKLERIEEDNGDETESDLLLEWGNLSKSTKKGWLQAAASEKEKYDLEVMNITGGNGQEMKRTSKTGKEKKPVVESKSKEESTSDEQKEAFLSPKNSGLKRKMDGSQKTAKSPTNKAFKKDSSDSDSSESSSDEGN